MKLKLDGYFLGPMLYHPIFLKKIRVTFESRTLIWVPLLLTITVNEKRVFFLVFFVLFFDVYSVTLYGIKLQRIGRYGNALNKSLY